MKCLRRPAEPNGLFRLYRRVRARWFRHYAGSVREVLVYPRLALSLGIGLLLASLLVARCLIDTDGFLSPDSTNYLSLAANLNEGRGFVFAGDGRFPARLHHFAEWPAGYPYLIHLLCAVTGASVFLSSKLVNMTLLLASAGLLGATFGRNGPLFVLTLAFAAYLDIFAYTWSEVPFIFLLLCAAGSLAGIWVKPQREALVCSLALGLSCAALFLSRYVGAFAISLIAIAVLISACRRQYLAAFFNLLLLSAVIALIGGYLRYNALLTHYATGMPRLAPTDSPGDRLIMLARALWSEAVVPVATFDFADWRAWGAAAIEVLGMLAVLRSVRRSYPDWARAIRFDALSLAFFIVGALYLAAIITLRWFNQFDPYDFRLLGPGTLMLIVACLRMALLSWPAASRAMAALVGAMASLSVMLALWQTENVPNPGYFANAHAIAARYASVPKHAVVLFGNDHVRYLRPDLFVTLPVCPPWFDGQESWDHFLSHVDKRKQVFVDMEGPALMADGCDRSIRAFLAGQHAGGLLRLTLR